MSVSTKGTKLRLALQIFLPIACALWLAFIFTNSLRTGTQSTQQSSVVVDWVQSAAAEVFPNGWVANAVDEDYWQLHKIIRKMAHFFEYAVLGGLLCWCYAAYTLRLKWSFLPLTGVVLIPVLDELLQTHVAGRAGTVADALLDMGGGLTGFAVAALVVWFIVRRIKKEKVWENKA